MVLYIFGCHAALLRYMTPQRAAEVGLVRVSAFCF